MRRVVFLSFFVFAATILFAQSKYLVYKETTKTGYTINYHILAGEKYAVRYDSSETHRAQRNE